MPSNHLEDFVAEGYLFSEYFVRRNVHVGPRRQGGYECELDIVAFDPVQRHLLHVEPSLDSVSWEKREQKSARKFAAGRRYIPGLFKGLSFPASTVQIAPFVYGSTADRTTLAGGQILLIKDFMAAILIELRDRRLASGAISEEKLLLRALWFAAQSWPGA